jgi:hypothetical protein
VEDRDANVLYPLVGGDPVESPPVRDVEVTPPQESYMISSILSDPNAHCITYGVCGALTIPGRPLAVKTGTSEPYEDSRAIGDTWTIGYTPQMVVGVWFGNADNSPMQDISSTNVSWRTVRDFAVAFHEDKPVEQFQRPDGLVETATCVPSNLKPDSQCGKTNERDLLPAHQVPQREDDWWTVAQVDVRTGKLASSVTPPQYIRTSRYLAVPEGLPSFHQHQAQEWARRLGTSANSAPTEVTTIDDIPVAIYSPGNGARVQGIVPIVGSAQSSLFEQYRLEYQLPGTGGDWELITITNQPVNDGELGVWDTSGLAPGPYTIRLTLVDQSRGDISVQVVVQVMGPDDPDFVDDDDDDNEGPGGNGDGNGNGNGGGDGDEGTFRDTLPPSTSLARRLVRRTS